MSDFCFSRRGEALYPKLLKSKPRSQLKRDAIWEFRVDRAAVLRGAMMAHTHNDYPKILPSFYWLVRFFAHFFLSPSVHNTTGRERERRRRRGKKCFFRHLSRIPQIFSPIPSPPPPPLPRPGDPAATPIVLTPGHTLFFPISFFFLGSRRKC